MTSQFERSAVRLELLSKDSSQLETSLGNATGCFFSRDNTSYLVTNWHVLTGRKPHAPRHSKEGAVVTHLRVYYHQEKDVGNGQKGISRREIRSLEVCANSPDGNSPIWIEDPFRFNGKDIAAIPCEIPRDSIIIPANSIKDEEEFDVQIGDSVLVVGYPEGLTGGTKALPIAKSGHVATSINIPHNGHPRFLIDARTYAGMSGAPIFSNAFCYVKGKSFGIHRKFLGIYSGRLKSIESGFPTEIGYCWHADYIERLLFDTAPWPASRASRLEQFASSPECLDSADIEDNLPALNRMALDKSVG